MLKGFTHARLACGCRITFREGVEGSPVTVVVDEKGKVTTFADIYGLDKKVSTALLGKSVSFPAPADSPEEQANGVQARASVPAKRTAASGLFGD